MILQFPSMRLNEILSRLPTESLSGAYPELSRKESFIREVVDSSESHFYAQKLMAREVFQSAFKSLKISDGGVISVSACARKRKSFAWFVNAFVILLALGIIC